MALREGKKWAAALAAGCCGVLALAAPAEAQYTTVQIMNGLFNPRGLTVAQDGSIYVAEAGSGGPGTQVVGAANETVGYGNTGGVSRFGGGVQSRLISTLPSLAPTDGSGATGLHDIIQATDGTFYGVIGFIGDPALRGSFTGSGENGQAFGRLAQFDFSGTPSVTYGADLSANETGPPNNPDGTDVNSNPYSLIQSGSGFAVVDAGANVLLDVTGTGTVSTKTIFPVQPTPAGLPGPPVYQPVPTAVALGADAGGNATLFVSQLSGFPFPVGGANIYAVNPTTGAFTTFATGFTTLVDIAYSNGSLYAIELTSNGLASPTPGPGNLWRIDVATGDRTQLISGLFLPGGVAIGANEEIYVSVGSVVPGGGGVVQVVAAPEPGSLALALAAGGLFVVRRRRKVL